MGFGIGVGIGWAAKGSVPITKGSFNIISDCKGKIYQPNSVFSQPLFSNSYSEGDYVLPSGGDVLILLGKFVDKLPEFYDTIIISGPAYDSCNAKYNK